MDTRSGYDLALLSHDLDLLRSKLRIAVVYGGDKNQPGSVLYKANNPRAWKSYEAVARDIQTALQELGFAHVSLFPDDMRLPQRLAEAGTHLAWLNTGGVQGQHPTSHASAMLEMLGLPYVGHNPLNAALLDTKDAFKRGLQALKLPTAASVTWHPASGPLLTQSKRFNAAFGAYDGPFVVKPVSGRASLHVYLAESVDAVARVANQVYAATQNSVLVESYLSGREYCVAVCGPITCTGGVLMQRDGPFAFSALERVLETDETIAASMDHKPITVSRFRLLNEHEHAIKHALTELAQTIYLEFDLQSIVRVDARADAAGNLYVLEVNPKPDLKKPTDTVTSLVMAGLPSEGMSYNDLILGLLADRLSYLLTYEHQRVAHIRALLSGDSAPVAYPPRAGHKETTRESHHSRKTNKYHPR